MQESYLGYIIGGSLKDTLKARLTVSAQKIQEGSFVIVESGDWCFYGLVTDLVLGATDPRFADEKQFSEGGLETGFPAELSALLLGQTLFTNLEILPLLMLDRGPEPGSPEYEKWSKHHATQNPRPIPVKTIPSHHAPIRVAAAGDVAEIFGDPNDSNRFVIGYTREQDLPVCIDLDKFVQRSAGVFGATGTGKSFLTRLLLAGLMNYNRASVLVLDMHNEYGLDDTSSDTHERVPGLKPKFGSRVRLVGLGRGSDIRGVTPDFNLELSEEEIQPQDIELLTRELNLRDTTPTILEALVHHFGRNKWFRGFKDMKVGSMTEDEDGKKIPAPDSVAYWAGQKGVNIAAAEALHSKMNRVFNLPYILPQKSINSIKMIIDSLEVGKHVILSFGRFETDLDYLLISNLLTRTIRASWEEKTNQFRGGQGAEPRPLIIVVEEAHKLLNAEMAQQTTFSTIAREMRKYYVTLLIVDQRPSQIFDEVLSQLGTRIVAWLGDEDDIHAVLSGLAGRDTLRGMLSRLQPKEEVLLLGWGIPMPILVRSRRYNDQFFRELLANKKGMAIERTEEQILRDLGF